MFLSYSVFSWEKHCIFIFTTVLNDFNDLIFHSLSLYVICSIDLQLFYVFATINNYVIYILVCMFLGTGSLSSIGKNSRNRNAKLV